MLVLATDWGFKDLRDYTITEIAKHPMPPLEKIGLARRAGLSRWLLTPLTTLATRLRPLEKDEMQILGWETTAAVMLARDAVLRRRLDAVRDEHPPVWMGTKWRHAECWAALCRALSMALAQPKYHDMSLPMAVEAATSPGMCSSCNGSKWAYIETWLDMTREKHIVERSIISILGGNQKGWVHKR